VTGTPDAANARRRAIPFWAMPVVVALPLWAYVYQATLEPAPNKELTPVDEGARIYASAGCVSCHLAGGTGSASVPALTDVLEVWPDFRDHMLWVRLGNRGWYDATGAETYGADARASNNGNMPAFANLSDEELAQVVLYERVRFGGLEETTEEYATLLAIATGEMTFADAGLGDLATASGVNDAALVR